MNTTRGKDAEQKQGLDHPANGQLINKKGAAAFMEAHLQVPKPKVAIFSKLGPE
jgi:hypothetical protein